MKNTLQPPPQYIHANISGNIQGNLNPAENATASTTDLATQNGQPLVKNAGSYFPMVFLTLLAVLVLVAAALWMIRRAK
ncbi:MAG: hypothetical protein PHF79_00300 [Candidatus Pacebacteria bacterium]|nr:hypothetical protein [Candidatus Paceibacterota bacterium]